MSAVIALSQAVMADAARRKVVWIVVVFTALLALTVPSLPSYGGEVVSQVYREVTVALMFTAALVVGLTLASTRIPAELERRTVFNVLARDVRRWQYVLGTWLGMFSVAGLVIAAFSAVALVTGYAVYRELMIVLLEGSLAVWLETGVVMALAVLVSTRFNPVTAIVAALAFLFVGHSITGVVPAGAAGAWWLPSLESFNVISQVAHGSGFGVVYGAAMLGAFFAWTCLLLLGASALFSRRDL